MTGYSDWQAAQTCLLPEFPYYKTIIFTSALIHALYDNQVWYHCSNWQEKSCIVETLLKYWFHFLYGLCQFPMVFLEHSIYSEETNWSSLDVCHWTSLPAWWPSPAWWWGGGWGWRPVWPPRLTSKSRPWNSWLVIEVLCHIGQYGFLQMNSYYNNNIISPWWWWQHESISCQQQKYLST